MFKDPCQVGFPQADVSPFPVDQVLGAPPVQMVLAQTCAHVTAFVNEFKLSVWPDMLSKT